MVFAVRCELLPLFLFMRMDGKKNMMYGGGEALEEFENMTENADQVQDSILKEILRRNGSTEYLKKYLEGSTDVSVFKNFVPVITHQDIRPYIQRIVNGEDSSLLTGHTITQIIRSSGTSGGELKLVPYIAEDLVRWAYLYSLTMLTINKYVPGLDKGKAMYLFFGKAAISTPSGLPIWTGSSITLQSILNHRSRGPFSQLTSPEEVILCIDGDQSMYCQLLSGLIYRHQVLRLGAMFAAIVLRAISFLEHNWADICDDIRSGKLNSRITDPGCRSAMLDIMKSPDQQLAEEIETICRRESWKGIICELWPKAKYIDAVVTGTMAQYIPAFEFYSAGKLPLVCTMYAASESYLGVNLKPLCDPADVLYTLVPNMAYFEFIPLRHNELKLMDNDEKVPQHKIVDLGHVTQGSYYELVVTTFSGLNRYRIGDIVQVAGFHKRSPQLRFICRRNLVLSIDTDRTSEEDLHRSVTLAKKLLEPYNAFLVDYTSYAVTSTVPGHYVLFWEIQHHTVSNVARAQILEECCIVLEEALDYEYRLSRTRNRSIGPLEIRVVKPGTFEALMDLCIRNGASMNQYKTPRGIKSSDALELLNSSVEGCFFSPRYPNVNPQ